MTAGAPSDVRSRCGKNSSLGRYRCNNLFRVNNRWGLPSSRILRSADWQWVTTFRDNQSEQHFVFIVRGSWVGEWITGRHRLWRSQFAGWIVYFKQAKVKKLYNNIKKSGFRCEAQEVLRLQSLRKKETGRTPKEMETIKKVIFTQSSGGVKVKEACNKPGVAQRVPRVLGSQISMTFGT